MCSWNLLCTVKQLITAMAAAEVAPAPQTSLSSVLDTAWYDVASRPGALRGDVTVTKRKRLDVSSPFVLQFNPEHEKNVREAL